jgi:cysteinyl-tRNA synthetase
MHNEFINLRGAKISKSKGGTLLLSDLERQGFHPLTYRYLLLGSRYRNQAEFTWDGLEGARIAHRRLLERVRGRVPTGGRQLSFAEAAAHLEDAGLTYLAQLDEAVSADLNTPQALAVVTQFSRDPALPAGELAVLVSAAEALLAIGLLDLAPEDLDAPPADVGVSPEEITRLLDERTEARRRGDFAAADVVRDRLDQVGIELRDTPGGTVWTARPEPAHRSVRLPQPAARPPGTPGPQGHSAAAAAEPHQSRAAGWPAPRGTLLEPVP